ncbi:hypothetical protein N9O57_01270 [bacterium]|nr:hypothetical protein [bacterium]
MEKQKISKSLVLSGLLLIFFGLILGAFISEFKNPRMALSTHLTALQHGGLLILLGVINKELLLKKIPLLCSKVLNIYSALSISFALFLAALWGTSSQTPIAGAGFKGSKMHEGIVNFFLNTGSVAVFIAMILVILGFIKRLRVTSES